MWDSIKSMFGGGDAPPEQLSGPVDPNATQQTFGQAAAPGMDWNKLSHAALGGLSAGRGDYGYAMRYQAQQMQQELQQNQIAQSKKIQDRQDLLTNLDFATKGRELGGKLGEVFTKQALAGLGFNKDEIQAIVKEDDQQIEQVFAPAMEKFLRENPEAGATGFKAFISRMSGPEKTKYLLSAQQERQAKLDAEGLSQLGQPQQAPIGGKPILQNPDGSVSTERTITIEADGKHYLIPTIVNGQQVSKDQAVQLWRSGQNNAVGVFNSAQEAEAAAQDRSNRIGQYLQTQQPQSPQTQAPANPQAMLNAQVQQSQAKLAALTQRRDLIQQATPDKVSPAGKKAALAELDKAISETRAEAGQFITQAHQAATEAAALRGQQQSDAHFNQVRSEIAANQAQATADRKAAADDKEAPGLYADKSTGEIRRITKGEKRDTPSNFKPVSSQDATTVDLLKTVTPQLDAMQQLTDRVLAKYPKDHLGKIIENYSKGKYGADEDIAQLQQVGNAVAIELTRALSGSSRPSMQLFNAIQGKEVPGIHVTRDVATRMIQTNRMAIDNRVKTILGQEQGKIETSNVNPSGPKIGDVVKGYRYRGGNPASQDSWVKAAP